MLCCVSKRAVAGADRGPPYEQPIAGAELENPGLELGPQEDVPPVLLPCAICARTFMPQSLEKHVRICERAAAKKRKPFDSAKQRIQGTDLAEFLPKQEKKRAYSGDRSCVNPKSSWKETHDDFLRAIRAARNEIVGSATQRQCSSVVSTGAPTRANEQGTCPTCNRHFGIKAYDRHVAWCKERVTRVPVNPATNIAKERLEARMKYRAPALKNRRVTNREKYSPGSATALQGKTLPTSLHKPRESVSLPNCNKSNGSPVKNSTAVRRSSQPKESVSPSVPMKSRPADRIHRPTENDPESISIRPTHPVNRATHFPVPPLKPAEGNPEKQEDERQRRSSKTEKKCRRNERTWGGTMHSARSQKASIVSARSQGNPKVNDVDVNSKVLEMVVQPCMIHNDNELITWKQISHEATSKARSSRSCYSLNFEGQSRTSLPLSQNMEMNEAREKYEDKSKLTESGSENEDIFPQKLNQTYLIRDLVHDFNDVAVDNETQKSMTNSPRIEFYLNPKTDYENQIEDSLNNFMGTSVINEMFPKNIEMETAHVINCSKAIETIEEPKSSVADECVKNRSDTSESDEKHMLQSFHNPSEDPVNETTSSLLISLENSTYEATNPTGSSTPVQKDVEYQNCRCPPTREKSNTFRKDLNVSTSPILKVLHEHKENQEAQFLIEKPNREIGCQVNICDCSLKHLKQTKSSESWRRRCSTYVINKASKAKRCDSNDSLVENESSEKLNSSELKKASQLSSDEACTPYKLEERMGGIIENYVNEDFNSDSDKSSRNNSKIFDSKENGAHSPSSEPRISLDKLVRSKEFMHSTELSFSKSAKSNANEMETKIRRSMNLLRSSTDTLVSAAEAAKYTDGKHSDFVEVETVEEISTKHRIVNLKALPMISNRDASMLAEIRERREGSLTKAPRSQLINLDPPYAGDVNLLKRNPKLRILPPVPCNRLMKRRNFDAGLRPVWSNYIRRRPNFNLVLSGRTGSCKDYDPFMLAEEQMNDLLSDTSESVMCSPSVAKNQTSFPLSHSSAFVKYPSSSPDKRSSLIAPPTEFDDFTSDFSSDSTETNSLSREVFLRDFKSGKDFPDSAGKSVEKKSVSKPLGRRVIIDKSKALGEDIAEDQIRRDNKNIVNNTERNCKAAGKASPKVSRSVVNRSHSIRASSAPKATADRKSSSNSNNNLAKKSSYARNEEQTSNANLNNRANNYASLSGSNLSLSSIVSSEVDIKRSNSVFDDLMTSFGDENGSFPASLRSLLRNDSLSISSPIHDRRQRNGQVSDEELSSPESYKRQDHNKMSADSAYSSLNRKYSNHGRSTNDVAGRLEDDAPRNSRREGDGTSLTKYKLSKFCHECGFQFPETAKFCCQCGIKRLAL